MNDLLSLIAARIDDDSIDLSSKVDSIVGRVARKTGCDSREQVAAIEAHVAARGPEAFRFDEAGFATLRAGRRILHCGRFTTPSLAQLDRAAWRPRRIRLVVLGGTSPLLDIGSLQAWSAKGTLFQVASQFNALESPGPYVAPIADYHFDPTQGPRASISAYPGTLLRHYAAASRSGRRFVQRTDGPQIDLIRDAIGSGRVANGYLLGEAIRPRGASAADADGVVERLESRFRKIRIGMHESVAVRFGHDWHGAVPTRRPRIDQVFTSTIAGGQYGAEAQLGRRRFQRVAETLLRAAYLGTLRSALALDRHRVVLTLIGGGVFGNPLPLIWRSILWAASECERENEKRLERASPGRDLEVHVNARDAFETFRGIRLSRDLATWKDRVTWVEFATRGRVRIDVAATHGRSFLKDLFPSTSKDAPKRRGGGTASPRAASGMTTPEDHLRSRVPPWIREASAAARRDRSGSWRERRAREMRFIMRARRKHSPGGGDVTVSWSGDFAPIDRMLQRYYRKQHAPYSYEGDGCITLKFAHERLADRALPLLRKRLLRLEKKGLVQNPTADKPAPLPF